MKKTRIGIIGAGGIAAKLHLPELAELNDRAQVTLISGRRDARLQLLCQRFAVARHTNDYDAVIADENVDAVIVATPHPNHVEWGIKALRAGKHLLMQKPLCGEMAEADAFVAEVEKHPRLTVLCLPHFPDAVHTVRQHVLAGDIGEPTGGRARTSHGGPEVYYREVSKIFGEPETGDLWFFDAKRAGVGALFDMGVYAVAHMVALLGTVRRVTAVAATIEKPTELEDTATLILQTEDGVLATAETSWCDPGRTWEFSVHGTAGKYVIPAEGPARSHIPLAYDSDHAPVNVKAVDTAVHVGTAHAHWIDCIERGVQPPVSHAYFARHVTEVLLAGLESAKTGRAAEVRSSAEK